MKDGNLVKSVIKAVKILEELIHNGSPLSISKISKRVEINISTVHRLINTLVKLGYVEQNEKGLYQLGLHSYEIADLINREFDLKRMVRPYLKEIVSRCNETSNLVVLEDNQVLYLDQIESNKIVRMFAGIGSRGPAYCTGSGKALLAHLDEEDLEEYIENTEFKVFTGSTITDPERLKEELLEIREQGYALDLEEMERGVCCVAAPILGKDDRLLGAISVSGPSTRISMDYLKKVLIPLVKGKAVEINLELQGI